MSVAGSGRMVGLRPNPFGRSFGTRRGSPVCFSRRSPAMSDITPSLAAIVADAIALLHDLGNAPHPPRAESIERAARLRLAATACHLTLMGCASEGETLSRPRTRQSGRQTLTRRELEVLRLIA